MKKIESKDLIVKSNTLVQASYRLTIGEQKVIYSLIRSINKDDEDFKVYKFKISEFIDMLGIKDQSKYTEIPKITKNLMKKAFSIHNEENNTELQIAWLSSAYYRKGEGIVELEFSPKLKPFLLKIKEEFTKFDINNVMQLKSSYSPRLYELLKQYQNMERKERIITIEKLKWFLGIESDEYKLYAHFKSRVIIPAQKELVQKTDISFEFEEKKEGRKVVAIKFVIVPKYQSIKQIEEQNVAEYLDINSIKLKEKFRKIVRDEFPNNVLKELINEKGIEKVNKYFSQIEKFDLDSKDNPIGFFIEAIRKEFVIPKGKRNNRKNISQADNFEQREYDDEYYNNFFSNVAK